MPGESARQLLQTPEKPHACVSEGGGGGMLTVAGYNFLGQFGGGGGNSKEKGGLKHCEIFLKKCNHGSFYMGNGSTARYPLGEGKIDCPFPLPANSTVHSNTQKKHYGVYNTLGQCSISNELPLDILF